MTRLIASLLFTVLAAGTLFAAEPHDKLKLLFEKNTLYQYIAVLEDPVKKERYLRNSRKDLSQGGISLQNPNRLLFPYTRMSFVSLAFLDREPKDALFVGLGVGAMPRYFRKYYPAADIDVVEIDADVAAAAVTYFSFTDDAKMKTHVEDGRLFVKRTKKKYDMIFLDAYQNDYIPFHLTTAEFLREVRAKLRDDGVVVSNILSEKNNKLFAAMIMTYRQVFPNLYVFKAEHGRNYIFVASPAKKVREERDVASRAGRIQEEKRFDIDVHSMTMAYETSDEYETHSVKPLSDDFAPVNLYKYQTIEPR